MITFAAIVPHSPLLLPTIGKEHCRKLKKTLDAYKILEEDLYGAKPETIVVLSPHGNILPKSFALLISPRYHTNLSEFGDLTTKLEFKADRRIIEEIRRLRLGSDTIPIVGVTEEFCDYGVAVPLYFLGQHLANIRVVTISSSELSLRKHHEAGKRIGEVLQRSTPRIAVIASADLAHTLTDSAPGGFSPAGQKFDETVVQALRKDERRKIFALEREVSVAKACGLRPIAMLLGILEGINCAPEPLSYEAPFGVGYLTARFNFH